VMMVNDCGEAARGTLELTLTARDGKELGRVSAPFDVPALGQQSYALDLRLPPYQGECWLKATANGTLSRRKVTLE
jgi:hypothetical protein